MHVADFLVVGSGIAGLSFALQAAAHGSVIVLTKSDSLESSTSAAQGGISAVTNLKDDSFESHVADTLDAGAGLCDEEVVRQMVQNGPEAIHTLENFHVEFDREASSHAYELGREGGHSHRRILHSKDTTGYEIAQKLLLAVKNHPNITLLEYHFAIDLITTAKLGLIAENRVLGLYALDAKTHEVEIFRSDRVVLATGGSGRVYLYTTNPKTATGDGVAMAWRAGAAISNMEFTQFHPTCFYNPRAQDDIGRQFLISEAVRGEGGILRNAAGKDFMPDYDPRGSLAPRDIVARAIDHEIKKSGKPCVYVDISHKPQGFVAERFPLIYNTCLSYGVDAAKEPIPVVPAAHYQCGGIKTDANGYTGIIGLYAAGENGCTGLHGANRLASNSLLEGVVVPTKALKHVLKMLPLGQSIESLPIPKWHHGDTSHPDELVVISHNWDEIRRLMWDYVSIVRTDKRLRRAATRVSNLANEVHEFYWGHRVTPDILELRNLVCVASLIVDCALRRQESRGLHYTLDYPEKNPAFAQKPTVIQRHL